MKHSFLFILEALLLKVSLRNLTTASPCHEYMHVRALTLCWAHNLSFSFSLQRFLSLSLPASPVATSCLLCTLSPSSVSVWGNWGKCAKLPYLGHTNNSSTVHLGFHPTNFDIRAKGQSRARHTLCECITIYRGQVQMCQLQDTLFKEIYYSAIHLQHSKKHSYNQAITLPRSTLTGIRALGSIGVKVTWLFKKWQRELLILCTRTDRAAAVTFNGITDCFRSTTTGFWFFCGFKSWTEEAKPCCFPHISTQMGVTHSQGQDVIL